MGRTKLLLLMFAGLGLLGGPCTPPPDTFVIAGQSNAVGLSSLPPGSTSSFAYLPRSFSFYAANGGSWKLANDPIHAPVLTKASAWPWMAEWWHQNRGRGVEFIATAASATCLVARDAHWDPEVGVLYQRMLDWVEASEAGDRLDAVLWYQGECDAQDQVPYETYKAALENLADAVTADLGVPLVVAPVSLRLSLNGSPVRKMVPIHDATIDAATDHPHIWLGPSSDDLALEPDAVHIHEVDVLGVRWAEAVAGQL